VVLAKFVQGRRSRGSRRLERVLSVNSIPENAFADSEAGSAAASFLIPRDGSALNSFSRASFHRVCRRAVFLLDVDRCDPRRNPQACS
jgi:hypothetical protein